MLRPSRSITEMNAVASSSRPSRISARLSSDSISAGSSVTTAATRTHCRNCTINRAASTPLPVTSPIVITTRSRMANASYQSPPSALSTCAPWYTALNCSVAVLGRSSLRNARCSVSATCCSRLYRFAFATARPARRPSSSAACMSEISNGSSSLVRTNVSAPKISPCAMTGTTIFER